MKLAAILLSIPLCAQPLLTISGPTTLALGQTSTTISITLTRAAGLNLAAIQWTVVLPPGVTVAGNPIASSALTAQGFGAYIGFTPATPGCAPITGSFNGCGTTTGIALGMIGTVVNGGVITADGLIATIPLALSGLALGQTSIDFKNVNAIDATGNLVTVSTGAALVLTVTPSNCDLNRDGKVDSSDVMLAMRPLLGPALGQPVTACPFAAGCTLQTLMSVLNAAAGKACAL